MTERFIRLLSVPLVVLLSSILTVSAARAATYTVNQLGDTGSGSGFSGDLRYCITHANSNPPPNTIKFAPGLTGTINLTTGLPSLMATLTILGPGANRLALNGHGSRPVIVASGASILVSGLTLTGGVGNGAGVFIFGNGALTLSHVAVTGNIATMGGQGGGIWNDGGSLTVNASTISGNSALKDTYGGGFGGGIYNGGLLSVNNSTISGNSASDGAGIFNAGKLTLNNSTIAANLAQLAAGGIMGPNNSGACTSRNTILAGNTAGGGPADVWGNIGSQGHNLIGNTTSGSGFAPTDLLNVNPKLGPLQNNGGPTLTHALLAGSPAINAGDNRNAPTWDQRGPGFPRIVHGTIDIGSFEVQ